jgi:hypothetical protein
MSADQALLFAGASLSVVAVVWLFGRLFAMLGWDNVLRMLRDPPILFALLGLLLVAASYFL